MKSLLCLLAVALLASPAALAQSKVAVYSFGEPGTAAYEHLSFWVKDGKRAEIYYNYGKERTETKGTYLARTGSANGASFAVKLSPNRTFTIIPSGTRLKVSDSSSSKPKTFAWEYEGPVNGIGTFCRECAENPTEAMKLVRAYYLK
ncbi:hypothetical protein Q5H92_25275 [Hymenobacter sp. M29]|uniref:DUF4384 domain-containing protein n=1 Tax=Hymenobacter mellowenesis TaxID=3063995 RepID=A0ABT9AIP6_9BACT|nr:hypothetical protein [Hymenobacter sp. M29]MDO7849699.1 hypothetical protein [Hymenobacter sp. M29]